MSFKTLQWVAVIALVAAFWTQWSELSFGWNPGWRVDIPVGAAMLFNLIVQFIALRRIRRERKTAAR